jgi:hypothetical protein
MNGLLVKKPWIGHILDNKKSWEIRGQKTSIRGEIALIESGTGKIKGTCNLIDVKGPLSLNELTDSSNVNLGHFTEDQRQLHLKNGLPYKKTYAWVLKNVKKLPGDGVSYKHPQGAVIWVKLNNDVTKEVKEKNIANKINCLC